MRMTEPRSAIWNSEQEEHGVSSLVLFIKAAVTLTSILQGVINKSKFTISHTYLLALGLLMGSLLTILDLFSNTVH